MCSNADDRGKVIAKAIHKILVPADIDDTLICIGHAIFQFIIFHICRQPIIADHRLTAELIRESTNAFIIYSVSLYFIRIRFHKGKFRDVNISMVNKLVLQAVFEISVFNILFVIYFYLIFENTTFSLYPKDNHDLESNLMRMLVFNLQISVTTNSYFMCFSPKCTRKGIEASSKFTRDSIEIRDGIVKMFSIALRFLFSIIFLFIYKPELTSIYSLKSALKTILLRSL